MGGHLQSNGAEPYNNLPLVAWLVQPLAGLSLSTYTLLSVILEATAIVVALFIAARVLSGSARLSIRTVFVVLVLGAPLPGLETLVFAQWIGLMLLALLGAYALARVNHGFAAGLALSVLLINPQDVWLVPLVLIVASAWPMLRGFAVGAGVWLLTSLAIVSVGTLAHITDSLNQNQLQEQFTNGLPGVAAAIAGPRLGFLVAALGIAAVAATWPLRHRFRRDPLLALDVGIAVSLLFSPHVFSADVLLMGAVLVDLGRRNLRMAVVAVTFLDAAYLLEAPVFHVKGHVQALALLGVTVLVVALAFGRSGIGSLKKSPRTKQGRATVTSDDAHPLEKSCPVLRVEDLAATDAPNAPTAGGRGDITRVSPRQDGPSYARHGDEFA